MNSDAAEQVVRLSLSGVDIAIRLFGAAAKNAAAILIAWSKKEKIHIGKTSLPKLLSSKDELQVLALTKEQFSQFQKLAKKKITYAPFLSTKAKDGKVDIIMSAKQRSFANHILSKVGYGTVEPGTGFHAEIMNSRDKQELSGMNFETHGGESKKNDTPSKGGSSGSREPSPRRSLGREEVKASVEKKLQENKRLLENRQKQQQPLSRNKNRSKPKPSRDAPSR